MLNLKNIIADGEGFCGGIANFENAVARCAAMSGEFEETMTAEERAALPPWTSRFEPVFMDSAALGFLSSPELAAVAGEQFTHRVNDDFSVWAFQGGGDLTRDEVFRAAVATLAEIEMSR